MEIFLIPFAVIGAAFLLAAHAGPHRTEEELSALPLSRGTVRGGTIAFNLLAVASYLELAWRLRPPVPAGAVDGAVVYGGPGDGFGFLFLVILWLSMQAMNLALGWASAAHPRQFPAICGILFTGWAIAGYLGWNLIKCPPGIVCAGG